MRSSGKACFQILIRSSEGRVVKKEKICKVSMMVGD